MISKIRRNDLTEAAKVYNKGLSMEIPKGYSSLERTIALLRKMNCFVYKEKDRIYGLIAFKKNRNNITIKFICTLKLREGIGKKLIVKLANFAVKDKTSTIYSTVSTKDKRVMKFYKYCGFDKYGFYKSKRDFIINKIKAKPQKIINSINTK